MRSKDVLGKRIVRVDHVRGKDPDWGFYCRVDRIVLDDGTVLLPFAVETCDCPEGDILVANYKEKIPVVGEVE